MIEIKGKKMNTELDVEKLIPAWQMLRAVAPVAHIESESDYAQATALLNSLLDIVLDDANHPLYSLVSVVGDLIEAYEMDFEPLTQT
jgi:HTH-type transcriptional regulator/antitoxin HigA